MKTVTGRVISEEPISLSKAATILSRFVSSENGASQDVSAYLRRASAAFTELKSFHREINTGSLKDTNPRSDTRQEPNQAGEFDEIGRAKGIDDLVEKRGKIRFGKSEAVGEEGSIHGREQDEITEDEKNKRKKNKGKDVVEEKVKEKLEDEHKNEESRKDKKKKNKKKEGVFDEKVNEKLEEEQRNEKRKERKKEKKKRKSDGEIGSEERKSKKKKKSKEIDV